MHYPGGKGGFYQKLINLMPPHEVYIESHLGGGAIMRHKRPALRNIGMDVDAEVLSRWRELPFEGVELLEKDAVSFLQAYEFTGKELVYCDPPYLHEARRGTRRIYKHEYSVGQHEELLEVIKLLPCPVMISGYESELYSESLQGWHAHSFQAKTRYSVATEWVWMNYPPPIRLHDYRYLGNTFRERERIRNKSKRWVERLRTMPALERQALLVAIESVMGESDR